MGRIDELNKAITGFDKQIAMETTSAALKKALQGAKDKAIAERTKLEAEEKDKPASAKKEEKAAEGGEKKPAKEKKASKKTAAKEKKVEKKDEKEEEEEYMVVNGVKYNMAICDELYAGMHARKEREKETQKKTKTRSTGEKAVAAVENATGKVTDVIPSKMIEDEPEKVIAALEKFEKDQEKSVIEFCSKVGVSKALTDKLANAYETVIAPIVKEIEEEIKANKEKAKKD